MTLNQLKKLPAGSILIFKNKEYYHIGSEDFELLGTPLCTQEQFEISFAHIKPSGIIRRFKKKIGVIKDLKVKIS